MKKDTIYFVHKYGCLIYVIDIKGYEVTFAAAHYLNDLFTTITQYKANETVLEDMCRELTEENYTVYTCFKMLGRSLEIKVDGNEESHKFTTEMKLERIPAKNISNKNRFKHWKYENIS